MSAQVDLTAERQLLLESGKNLIVLGGPGSGKTTIALLKADREIRAGILKHGQKILFLSFARATVARVAQHAGKLLNAADLAALEINTYHGFTWSLLRCHGYLLRKGRRIALLPPPEGAARLSLIKGSENRLAEKRRLLVEEGLLHFDLFAESAAKLLTRSESLRRIICDAYPIIILDEFQDTNQEEWAFIKTLGTQSRIIALADAEQRIYEFRGADPKRIGEFVSVFGPETFDFGSENHRSNGTDIAAFGNDLLTHANKQNKYNDVTVVGYGFYRGRSALFQLKGSVIKSIKRLLKMTDPSWSLAILVPTKQLMIQVSDYLSATVDGYPVIPHEVALDTTAPALSAVIISSLLEGGKNSDEISARLISNTCTYIRGRKGSDPLSRNDLELLEILDEFSKAGVMPTRKKKYIHAALEISRLRGELVLTGDASVDWLATRDLLASSNVDVYQHVANDAKYLRLLHKGALLRSRLGELWRTSNSYIGAEAAVRDALVQEHFSTSLKEWRGVHVMTIHKSKGKEFSEVIIFEGSHQGRICRAGADERQNAQALLALRVAVTRAMKKATILTPAHDPCPFL